jgi:hypothetical protein
VYGVLLTERTLRQLQKFTALDEHFTQKRTFADVLIMQGNLLPSGPV